MAAYEEEGDLIFSQFSRNDTESQKGRHSIIYADGSYQEGYIENNRRVGKCRYVWSNGDRYEGNWLDSRRHGFGAQRFIDGAIYEGYWQED